MTAGPEYEGEAGAATGREAASPPKPCGDRTRMAERKHRHIVWLGVFAGALLFFIGVRFMIVPEAAVFTFGLAEAPAGTHGLHSVIGLRDLWLGALAIVLAGLREWRALALWLLFAVPVCWADAAIVATHAGPGLAIAFHIGAGFFCLFLGLGAWRRSPKRS